MSGAERWTYAKGLHDLGGGAFAYLQPNGDWGWSNAGFVRDGDASLLIDTLFDARLTSQMLTAITDATGVQAADIETLVNTHANGDHTFGNGLVTNARIIVALHEVGPAHTAGDVIAHSVEDGVVFTGDILFIDGTPIMWAGPVGNWLKACDLIVALDPRVIVPGHGPITDIAGVRRVQAYLRYIDGQARARYDAGMGVVEAALDIALGDYAAWGDAERIAVNVSTLYREYRGGPDPAGEPSPFAMMATLAKRGPRR
ncbi:MAG TPA: MBL fold metallo-hydrolase [Caulobacteraceae bacterium]